MTATLEQTQNELPRLVRLAQQGEEVLITEDGKAVARITALRGPSGPPAKPWDLERKQAWLSELDGLRAKVGTGKAGPSIQEILDEARGS